MGQPALLDPIMIKKWGNKRENLGCFSCWYFLCERSVLLHFYSGQCLYQGCPGLTGFDQTKSCLFFLPLFWCGVKLAHLHFSDCSRYNEGEKEDCTMRKQKFKVYLTPAENSIVIQSLNHLRNTLLRENRDTGCVDDLLLKVMCAPVKRI